MGNADMTDPISSPQPIQLASVDKWSPGNESDPTPDGKFWASDDGPSFGEFLDMINPLQHIPVISSIYRAITGDEIGAGPRAIGGMIYGGPLGMIAAGITALFEEASGGDVATTVAHLVEDMFDGASGDAADPAANVAENAGNPSDAPAAAAPVAMAAAQAAAEPMPQLTARQAALLSSLSPAAGGHIAYNPGAALGMPQAQTGPAPAESGTVRIAAAQPAAASARDAGTVPPVALQFAGQPASASKRMFPAHPGRTASGTVLQSAGQAFAQGARANPGPVQTAKESRADRLLAQWAQQQMALQKAAAAAPETVSAAPSPAIADGDDVNRRSDSATGRKTAEAAAPSAAPAHPMLAPGNAGPEWYARAMDAALNKYQAAQGLRGAAPAPAGAGLSQ